MKNFSRKFASVAIAFAMVFSTITVPTVFADTASNIPIDYDFTDDVTIGTEVTVRNGDTSAWAAAGAAPSYTHTASTVGVNDGALKVHMEPYKYDTDSLSFSTTTQQYVTPSRWSSTNMMRAGTQFTIPYSGLGDGENLRVEFEWKDDDGVFNSYWGDFGTLVNSDGYISVLGIRAYGDTQDSDTAAGYTDFYFDATRTSYKTNQMTLVGAIEPAATGTYTFTPVVPWYNCTSGSAGCAVEGHSHWPNISVSGANQIATSVVGTLGNDHGVKVRYDINRATKKVNVYYDDVLKGSFYTLADITSSGSLNFCGAMQYGPTETDDITIDNVKITTWEPMEDSVLPIDYDFEDDVAIGDPIVVTPGKRTVAGVTYTHAANNVAVSNGALEIHLEQYNWENDTAMTGPTSNWEFYNMNYASSLIEIPYTGLGENENLRVEFEYNDANGSYDSYWGDFGSLVNSDGNICVLGLRGYALSGAYGRPNSEYGRVDQVSMIGVETANGAVGYEILYSSPDYWMGDGQASTDHWKKLTGAGDSGNVNMAYAVDSIGDDHGVKVRYDINRATKQVNVYYDDVLSGSFYTLADITSSGSLNFYGSVFFENGVEDIKIDNVKMTTWEPFELTSTNFNGASSFNAEDGLTFTFNHSLGCTAEEFKSALTIANANGVEVGKDTINVALNNDNTTATITVTGGLQYGATTYTVTLDAELICDDAGVYLAEDWSGEFTTALGKELTITSSSVTAHTAGSLSVSVSVNNPKTASLPMWCVLAVYDSSDALIGVISNKVDSVATGALAPFTLTAGYEGTAARASLLLWNNSLVPYHVAIPVNVTLAAE